MFNLALALAFASRGFHVFPLNKSPNPDRPWIEPKGWNRFKNGLPSDGRVDTESGETCATVEERLIAAWSKLPNTVGYGVCSPFHIVFDLDVKNGKDGVTQFSALKLKYGIPNPSIIVRTKSGGMHLYYERDQDFVTARVGKATNLVVDGVEYPGVDLIANSGYVVGPNDVGSKDQWHEGQYLLVKGDPIESLTVCPVSVYRGQIRSGIETRVQAKPTTADELITNRWQEDPEYEITSIIRAGKVPPSVPAGKRDSLLTSFIGVLKSRRLPKDTARILCERFLDNCELAVGETRESFIKSVNLESKLARFYAVQGDSSDPRVVARELVDVAKTFKLVDQLHGSIALIAMEGNPYLTSRVVYTETKARQDLSPYARPIPDSDSKRPVNPYDILIRDASMPKVHSVGYKPIPSLTYVDAADGMERVNMYVPPLIPVGSTRRSNIVDTYVDLTKVICGDLSDYFLDFMAHIVQKPYIKMGVALLIISKVHGSGKNTLVQVMKPIIGPKNYLPVSGLGPLVEDKSVLLEGNVLVVINEVARPSNRSAWSDMAKAINKLKTSITESSTQINPKYEKQRTITTYSNIVMLSNDAAPFDLEAGDRRIAVVNNDPPKMDQSRFSYIADFAHNEKNGRLSPREYDDAIFELHEFLINRKISHNLSTGDAPSSAAKLGMIGTLMTPVAQALKAYRDERGAGATSDATCEEKLVYIIRAVLGYKEFGRNKDRYDIWEQFTGPGILRRVHRAGDPTKVRVVDGLPGMREREDYPLISKPVPTKVPQRVFVWGDLDVKADTNSNPVIRDMVWSDVEALRDDAKGRGDVLSLVK